MIIQEMSREDCFAVLARSRLGRLACAREGQPYVIPLYFVYDRPASAEEYLYSFSAAGQKIEWMRANPLVCVELDEVTACDEWTSVLIFGHYEELPDRPDAEPMLRGNTGRPLESVHERHRAWQLLQANPMWWQPGSCACAPDRAPQSFQPVFYRIRIGRITGRRAVPSPEEQARPTALSSAEHGSGWIRSVLHALSKPFVSESETREAC